LKNFKFHPINSYKQAYLVDTENVDTTVQEKFIRYPTDARLYDRARSRLVDMAKERNINLRQIYSRVSKKMFVLPP